MFLNAQYIQVNVCLSVFTLQGGLLGYTMMLASYWGVKRVSEFRPLVEELGPVVLDPYGGSGELIRAALAAGKRAIYNDLNPVAAVIAKFNTVLTKSDIAELKRCLSRTGSLRNFADRLYTAYCEKCGKIARIKFNVWHDGVCTSYLECGHTAVCKDISSEFRGFLTRRLAYEDGKPFKKAKPLTLKELFTRRNLLLLTLLHDIVLECGELSKLVFISILFASSKMAFIPQSKFSKKGWRPSWAVPAYWLPRTFAEYNPVELFEKTASRILRARPREFRVGSPNDVLEGRADVAFLVGDVLDLDIPHASVDVFTDPPYYGDIQYAELYYFHAVWLGLDFSKVFENELIVNEARGLTYNTYLERLDRHISKLSDLTREKAIFILRGGRNFQDLLDIISKYYYVYDIQNVQKGRKGSRIGDTPQHYTYYIIKATVKR